MKRLAAIVVLAMLSTACFSGGRAGSRGPRIDRSVEEPAQPDEAVQRELELGQR
jgi:hypothetical protein